MSDKSLFIVLASIVIGVAVGTVALATLTGKDDKKVVVKKEYITQKSTIDQLDKFVKSNVRGLEKANPEVVWMSPNDGSTLSEKFIFSNFKLKTEAQKNLVRTSLKKNGFKRVYEDCRGITKRNHAWSFGYCTYRPAPIGLQG